MATQDIVSALNMLADDVENNLASATDVCDRVKTLSERVEGLSALTGLDASGVLITLTQVLALGAARRVGRPTIEIPAETIEWYICHGFKIREIAALYGVCRTTIHNKMLQNGLR